MGCTLPRPDDAGLDRWLVVRRRAAITGGRAALRITPRAALERT